MRSRGVLRNSGASRCGVLGASILRARVAELPPNTAQYAPACALARAREPPPTTSGASWWRWIS
eukprot:10390470-Alexandrium_andersonii.AAC.1